jgi:UDPglucose 6-dehydrogenase
MKISVIGSGYVGIVTALGFANINFKVTNIDIDKKKVKKIQNKELNINEPGLHKLLLKQINKNYFISDKYEDCLKSDCIFLAVNTPHKKQGIDLSFLILACKKILFLVKKFKIKKKITIVIKSTVVPGTLENQIKPIFKDIKNIYVANNPEFLREGSALSDFINSDRIVIGSNEKFAIKILSKVYKKFSGKKFFFSPTEAELCKYYSNIILSNLIAFSNEFADVCELFEDDVNYSNILKSFMFDRRFNIKRGKNFYFPEIYKYLIPGPGYGGSCFPKDTKSFYKFTQKKKLNQKILGSIIYQNNNRLTNKLRKIKNKFKSFCVIGVGFKEGTSDLRESKSIELMKILKTDYNKIFYIDKNVYLNDKKFIKINFNQLRQLKIEAIIIMNHDKNTIKYNWEIFLRQNKNYLFDFRARLKPSKRIKVIGSNF